MFVRLYCFIKQTKQGKTMNTLATLKLTTTKKPSQIPQVLQRRNKLGKRIWEQIEIGRAHV